VILQILTITYYHWPLFWI